MIADLLQKRDVRTRLTAALFGLLAGLGGLVQAQGQEPTPVWPSQDLLQGQLPKQVLIEVLVADISHAQDEDLGVEHEFVNSGEGSVPLFNDLSRINPAEPEYVTRFQSGDLGSVIARFPLTERPDELFQGLDIVGQILDVDSGQLFAAIQALVEEGKGETGLR